MHHTRKMKDPDFVGFDPISEGIKTPFAALLPALPFGTRMEEVLRDGKSRIHVFLHRKIGLLGMTNRPISR